MIHPRPAMLLIVVFLAGCGTTVGPTSETVSSAVATRAASPAPTVVLAPRPSPTLQPGVAQAIAFEEDVWGVVASGDTIWVEGQFKLHQLDGSSGQALRTIEGSWPRISDGSLWHLRGEDEVVEADPDTGEERRSWTPPDGLHGTTVHDSVLWASPESSGLLIGFDLELAKVLFEVPLPAGEVKWIEAWKGLIWVIIDGGVGHVVRVDPESGDVVDELAAGSRPHSVVTAFGSLWITDHGATNVLRFAPDGTLQATISGPGSNVAIAATEDAVWAAGPDGLYQIDPETNSATRQFELGVSDWYGLAVSGGSLWLTNPMGRKVLQIPL